MKINAFRKARIGVIGLKGFPAFGGSARAGECLVEKLSHKYEFTIYNTATHTNRKTGDYGEYKQIVFRKFPIRKLNTFVYYVKSLLHCLFCANYDLIHVYHIDAAFIIPILKIRYKVIAGVRARPQLLSKWNLLEKQYFKCMESIFLKMPPHIMTSNSIKIIEEYQSRTRRTIQYIPNGILFNNGQKILPRIEYSDYILFASGRIVESKGCHVFLKALRLIDYKGKVLVVGDLTQSPKYAAYLNELADGVDVTFTGLIRDNSLLRAYICNAQLAVYPSFVEAMSNMLLEISSLKIPLICSDIPENTVVFDETEAVHFRNGDADDLATKIEWAYENMDVMKLKAEKAFNKLISDYNWEQLAVRYDELFQALL